VKSFVIDAEAVAFDLETKKLLPFQDLSRRKRKDVRTEDITVRVHLFAFDLLYLNGEVSRRDIILHAHDRRINIRAEQTVYELAKG
jgi:ATP-dependent DNA ligase